MKLGIGSALSLLACGAGEPAPLAPPARAVVQAAQAAEQTWLLHLPGIAGRRWIDEQMLLGFRDGRFTGDFDIYDWTCNDPGLNSLLARKRNEAQAQLVADQITQKYRKNPNLRIVLSGHSGGTGIAVWALEKLPDDVKVDTLLLLASALSPSYDLTRALSHVRSHCYNFCSDNDVMVLGLGTRAFGTIDGVKTEAAGEYGFVLPVKADRSQYEKLVQKPYDKSYMQYNNLGDHLGCMLRPFASHVVAPLIRDEPRAVAGTGGRG